MSNIIIPKELRIIFPNLLPLGMYFVNPENIDKNHNSVPRPSENANSSKPPKKISPLTATYDRSAPNTGAVHGAAIKPEVTPNKTAPTKPLGSFFDLIILSFERNGSHGITLSIERAEKRNTNPTKENKTEFVVN